MTHTWTLLKLGGSLLTNKRGDAEVRLDVIERVAKEIAEAWPEMSDVLLIGHGSGSFGHVAAQKAGFGRPRPIGLDEIPPSGISATQDAAARLHRLVMGALLAAGLPAYSQAPSSFLVSRGGRPSSGHIDPIQHAVDRGLVPVVFGDVVMDTVLGTSICSTEEALAFLVPRLRRRGETIRRVIWLGETDGIYDAEGQTIPLVHSSNYNRVRRSISPAAGFDVTGGMLLRLKTAWNLARRGTESRILDGTVPGVLKSALLGGEELPGTHVPAKRRPAKHGSSKNGPAKHGSAKNSPAKRDPSR